MNSKQGIITIAEPISLDNYTNSQGKVTTDGMRSAISDWRSGKLDTETMRVVIRAWRTGESVNNDQSQSAAYQDTERPSIQPSEINRPSNDGLRQAQNANY
jgi:hypothetical protein